MRNDDLPDLKLDDLSDLDAIVAEGLGITAEELERLAKTALPPRKIWRRKISVKLGQTFVAALYEADRKARSRARRKRSKFKPDGRARAAYRPKA